MRSSPPRSNPEFLDTNKRVDRMASQIDTAILFLVFNRPHPTKKVFEAIRKAKPKRLYVASDGPRNTKDAEQLKKVLEIATAVDWPCELKTLSRSSNLGCKYAVSGGIDWFFECEESGIILEDDVLPSEGFFEYCQAALEKFRHDPRVGMVTGQSIESKRNLAIKDLSVKFSTYALIWGWATWRHVWKNYDAELIDWDRQQLDFLRNKKNSNVSYVSMWCNIFTDVQSQKIDSWDHQLQYLLLKKNLLCVVPPYNLIDNLGYGVGATHTTGSRPKWLVAPSDFSFQESLFSEPLQDVAFDLKVGKEIFGINILTKVKHFIKKTIAYLGCSL